MSAKINYDNIKGFLQGWSRKLFGIDLPYHIREQAYYRLVIRRPECDKNCQHCGCSFPEKAFEDRGCEHPTNPCYGPMLQPKEWEEFKKELSR